MLGYLAKKALICGLIWSVRGAFLYASAAWLRVPAVNIWSIKYES